MSAIAEAGALGGDVQLVEGCDPPCLLSRSPSSRHSRHSTTRNVPSGLCVG